MEKINKALTALSIATFGVYLIHMIILHTFVRLLDLNLVSLKSAALIMVLTAIFSYIASYVLNRIPYVSNLVKWVSMSIHLFNVDDRYFFG